MKRRRGIIAAILLIVVLLVLPAVGFVQYRWLTDASEGQAAEMQRVLRTATRQLRVELAVELGSLVSLIAPRLSSDAVTSAELMGAEVGTVLHAHLAVWAAGSRFPDLISGIYIVDYSQTPPSVLVYDEEQRTFAELPEGDGETYALLTRPDISWDGGVANTDPSTLRVPIPVVDPVSGDSDRRPAGLDRREDVGFFAVVDTTYLAEYVIPLLITDYLGADSRYHVAVVDHATGEVLFSDTPIDYPTIIASVDEIADEAIPLGSPVGMPGTYVQQIGGVGQATLSLSVVEQLRDPVALRWMTLRNAAGLVRESESGGGEPVSDIFGPAAHSGLTLYLWHPLGGIDRAVAIGRNRNLAASYVVLGLLAGASVGFYLLSRRAMILRDREHEFVATVTHELRTPISAIHGAADNLAAGIVASPDRVQEYGKALLIESRRLRAVVDQVLLYAGLQGGLRATARHPVDLAAIVDTVSGRIDGLRQDRLTVEVYSRIAHLAGDPVAVESILITLLSNAVKHNEPGTRVSLRVESEAIEGQAWLMIQVSDDGRGIPTREIGRVREPFFRGALSQDLQVPGTGLGLSLVQRIAQTYSGTMRIDSPPGHGTRVTVRVSFGRVDE